MMRQDSSMQIGPFFCKALIAGAVAAGGATASRAQTETPVAGKQVRFEKGFWSAVPQAGPDGKVRQCVLVALRQRPGVGGETRFGFVISRGSGFAITLGNAAASTEAILDDQAEIVAEDGHSFPAVAFNVATSVAFHPGDVDGVLAALEKTPALTVRTAGAGVDSGPITLELPGEALAWLKACGKTFNIALDKPTDPGAPDMPAPRPRSPKVAAAVATAAGPPGIEDKQKISGWDASELRARDGSIAVCVIRRRYTTGSGPNGERILGTYLMASKAKGLTVMLKDTDLKMPQERPMDGTLLIDNKPFAGVSVQSLGSDEIGLFPAQPKLLAAALENGTRFNFKSKTVGMEFPVQAGVIPWLRACARRSGFGIEPAVK
jgi:hypothetical protein